MALDQFEGSPKEFGELDVFWLPFRKTSVWESSGEPLSHTVALFIIDGDESHYPRIGYRLGDKIKTYSFGEEKDAGTYHTHEYKLEDVRAWMHITSPEPVLFPDKPGWGP